MYMAPEISFGSRHAQSSSDVFAFGVIAYELLTKELPFKKPPVGSVMRHETLVLPQGLRKRTDLDKGLISLLEKALNVDPAQRPTAAQLAEALTRLAPPVGRSGRAS
jgi:serine/threonine protein kinase